VSTAAAVQAVSSLPDNSLATLKLKRESLIAGGQRTQSTAAQSIAAIEEQLDLLRNQKQQLESQRSFTSQRVAIKQAELQRNESLAKGGFVTEQYLSALRADLASLQSSLADIDQRAIGLVQQQVALKQQATQLRGQADIDSERVRQDVAEVENRVLTARDNRRVELHAPRALMVSAIHVESGHYVLSDTPVLTSVDPDAPRVVQCLLSARAAVGLAPGTAVRLRYAAFPYAYYGSFEGRVVSIDTSPWRGNAHEGAASAPRDAEPLYRVVVRPLQQTVKTPQGEQPLLPGMQAQVEIPKQRRALIEWLLLPARHL
jgi:membrane fusion protein